MSDKDDKLNPLSENFDPLAALYSDSLDLPDPDAPLLDNVSRFEQTSHGVDVKTVKQRKVLRIFNNFNVHKI